MNAVPHWKQLDHDERIAARCWQEIGENLASGNWWRDVLAEVPDAIWDQISELMADDDSAEAGNVLMEWGKAYAKRTIEQKHGVRLL